MSRDEIVSVALVLAFASWVTAHVALVAGLAVRRPRWRAVAALAIVPLAPWWGRTEGMHRRTVAWVVGALAYALLRWLASR
jgi:hypothetical protein